MSELRVTGRNSPWARRSDTLEPLGIYALSRLLTLAVAGLVSVGTDMGFVRFMTMWDGGWFLTVVRQGYPAQIPEVAGQVSPTTIPFFPLFPLITRFIYWLLPVSEAVAGILVSLCFGALAAVLLHRLTSRVAGREVARRAVMLFCFFPSSFVLSMPYSEGLMIALAAACLLALLQERWLVAGVCAALATATRPTALALVLACLWQAGVAVHERREWRSLVAPAMAPLGILAYFGYLWAHTGEALAYLHAQEAWNVAPGLGRVTGELLLRFIQSPVEAPLVTIVGLSVVFAAVGSVILVRRGWPGVLSVYAVTILVLSIASRSDGLRPRDILTAFPVIMAISAVTYGARLRALRAVFAGGLVLSMMFHNVGAWNQP